MVLTKKQQPRSMQEIHKEWIDLLAQGDAAKSQKQYMQAKTFYLQSASLAEKELVWNKNFAIMCAHSHEQLADLCNNFMHEQGHGLFHCKEAVKYCEIEGIREHLPQYKSEIMCMCYFAYGTALTLMPQRDYPLILKVLEVAWRLADQCSKIQEMIKYKIANMFIAVYSSLKDQNNVEYWSKQVSLLNYQSNNTRTQALNQLMEIERSINPGSAKEQIQKASQLFEDTRNINPEFAASVAGQIIYYHRKFSQSVNLEDGIEWGIRALSILQPMFGEKHGVICNVYLSLSDTYARLGQAELAMTYKKKMENSQKLMGM